MTRQELILKLGNLKNVLSEQYGIEKIALFGSYARDEANEDSDVDIVILEAKVRRLENRLNAKNLLEASVGKKVDLGYFDSMKTFVKNRIQKDLIYV